MKPHVAASRTLVSPTNVSFLAAAAESFAQTAQQSSAEIREIIVARRVAACSEDPPAGLASPDDRPAGARAARDMRLLDANSPMEVVVVRTSRVEWDGRRDPLTC
jgi:hypothetical protein